MYLEQLGSPFGRHFGHCAVSVTPYNRMDPFTTFCKYGRT